MKKFTVKRILVPTDFSETAANAIRQAVHLASECGAKIKLLHVVTPVYGANHDLAVPYVDEFYADVTKRAMKGLRRIADEITHHTGVNVIIQVKSGIVDDVIDEVAWKDKCDLIMMGTHGVSGIREVFIGSNAYRVVHDAPCPVITIQRKAVRRGFKNIILPIRLDLYSRQKVDYVVEIAKIFDSTVHITGFTSSDNEYDRNRLRQYVNQVEKYLGKKGIDYKSACLFKNNFTKAIVNHAKKNKADLIAISMSNDFSFDQLVSGPYAQQFVNHSSLPVFSVPVVADPDDVTFTPYLSGVSPV